MTMEQPIIQPPDIEVSDVDLNDEMGAPKPIWLINIEREEKKKRVGATKITSKKPDQKPDENVEKEVEQFAVVS
jgi:hypothetical protein